MPLATKPGKDVEKRERIVKRIARELRDGFYVNLGIGMPTLVANHVPAGMHVILQSENGMLGIGPYPLEGEEDADLINAGKETVSEMAGARRVVVAMEHTTHEGQPKILRKCTLPLTGMKVVDTIVTEMAYIRVTGTGLVLEEVAPGSTADDVQGATEPTLILSPNLRTMEG